MFCNQCGTKLEDDAMFCGECGNRMQEPVVEVQPEPVVEVQPEPVVAVQPEPVVAVQPEPVVAVQPEPVVAVQPEPVVVAPKQEKAVKEKKVKEKKVKEKKVKEKKVKEKKVKEEKPSGVKKVLATIFTLIFVVILAVAAVVAYLVWDGTKTVEAQREETSLERAKLQEEKDVADAELEAQLQFASEQIEAGEYDKAFETYLKVKLTDDKNCDVYIGLSEYYKLIGDLEGAHRILEEGTTVLGEAVIAIEESVAQLEAELVSLTTDESDHADYVSMAMDYLDRLTGEEAAKIEEVQAELEMKAEELDRINDGIVVLSECLNEVTLLIEEANRLAEEEERLAQEAALFQEMLRKLDEAYTRLMEGDSEAAIVLFEELIAYNDEDMAYYKGLAEVYIADGYFASAADVLQMGLEKIGYNDTLANRLEELSGNSAMSLRTGKLVQRNRYDYGLN